MREHPGLRVKAPSLIKSDSQWSSSGRRVLSWASIVLFFIGTILLGIAVWIRRTFGPISVDQMLLHLPAVGGGVSEAEYRYAWSLLLTAVLLPVILSGGLLFLAKFLHLIPSSNSGRHARQRIRFGYRRLASAWTAIGVFAVGSCFLAETIDMRGFIRAEFSSLDMADYYTVPSGAGSASPVENVEERGKPKNLVMIFMESIEDGMSRGDLFEQSLLASLESKTQDWGTIPEYRVFSGGGWTMAGLVGTSCGLPLRGPGLGKNDLNTNEIGAEEDSFLPGATCLGDTLKGEGYTNVFLGGADVNFASKKAFLESHGYDEVKGLSDWVDGGATELSPWGLSDGQLFEEARSKVAQLRDAGEPFNLTLLTLDSHEPAHLFDYCDQTTEDLLESVTRCSIEQVTAFIDYLGEMGYLDDTVVVLTGDHLKMLGDDTGALNRLDEIPERTLFNRIWSPDGVPELRRGADQLSMFATVLDLLGVQTRDHRAGVGVSTLVQSAPDKVLGVDEGRYEELIESRSRKLYRHLWGPESADKESV